METITDTHRHEFYLTDSAVGRESGETLYVSTCACGARETVLAAGRKA